MTDPRLTFFPGRRVRLELNKWIPKRNNEGEKRVRLDFMIPLVDEASNGQLPGWLIDPLAAMSKEDNPQSDANFKGLALEGVTLELWDVPKAPERMQLFAAATLQDFALTRATRDKQTFLALEFNCNVKRDHALLRWCDKFEECFMWAAFTPADPAEPSKNAKGQQMTIGDAKSAAAGDQTGDEAYANAQAFLQQTGAKAAVDELPTTGRAKAKKGTVN